MNTTIEFRFASIIEVAIPELNGGGHLQKECSHGIVMLVPTPIRRLVNICWRVIFLAVERTAILAEFVSVDVAT
jgi:hypothetical protein